MKTLAGRLSVAAFFAALMWGSSSLNAVPMTMYYQVTDLGDGVYHYNIMVHVDNNDFSFAVGQGWRWMIFGDANQSGSPLRNFQLDANQLPVGPWTALSSSGGGHNGPTWSDVLLYWIPTGIGDVLHWSGTATADLAQGAFLWSTIAGTVNGGVPADFTVAQRVDPGVRLFVDRTAAQTVLNNETGGGNGFTAGTFTIDNNSAAAGTVTSLQITGMGSGSHTGAYSSFAVYRDEPASGTVGSFDPADAQIASGALAGTPPVIDISLTGAEQNFGAGILKRYFIVVELNGTAASGDTLQYRVSAMVVTGATRYGVPSRTMNGLVIATGDIGVSSVVGLREQKLVNAAAFEAGSFFVTAAASGANTLSSLTIRGTGTGNHATAYSSLSVYRDQTASGTIGGFDAGDVLVGTGAFAGSPATAPIAVAGGEQAFAAGQSRQYFIVPALNGTPQVTQTFDYEVLTATIGSGTLVGAPTLVTMGFEIIRAEMTFRGRPVTSLGVVPPGKTDHVVQAFELGASVVTAQTLDSLTVLRTGSISDAQVTAVKLWSDANRNGVVDTGDSQLGGTQTFSGGSATFSGSPLANLTAASSARYLITYTIDAAAANNTTFGATWTPTTHVGASPGPVRVITALNTASFTVFLVNSFSYTQDFEAFTLDTTNPAPLSEGWWNDTADGTTDWFVDNGGTQNPYSGPTTDHNPGTAAGKYLYHDSWLFLYPNFRNLVSPPFDISGLTVPRFEFWVHSFNGGQVNNPSRLHIDLIDADTGVITPDWITAIGHNAANTWLQFTLDLSTTSASTVQIRFRIEVANGNVQHDIAIDDITLRDLPDIDVRAPGGALITNGGNYAAGGILTTGQTLTFTVENNGGGPLNLTGNPRVAVQYMNNVTATVPAQPAAQVGPGSSTTFDVLVQPGGAVNFDFGLRIESDDPADNPYDFTVSGNGVSNQPPQVSIPGASNWQNTGGNNYTLTVNPGAAYNDALTVTDPTPDNMTMGVTPPGTVPTTITTQPASIGAPTAGPFTLTWAGTADATNPPGNYTWQITVDDTFSTLVINCAIIIADLPPTHAIGTDASSGDGQASGTAYLGSALVGATAALTLADLTNPNTGQAMSLAGVTPNGANPAGGSGFAITFVADSIVATPTAALQLADLGTHLFAVDIQDAGNTVTVHVGVTVVTPEIDVARGPAIADGGADAVTGALAAQPSVLDYVITNSGTSTLNITTVVISNQVNCAASVTGNPAGTVAPSGNTTLQITVTPGPGAFSFEFDINNDDVNEDPYDISVSGNAAAAPEINVSRGASIPDGGTDAIGDSTFGQARDLVYTISNSGTANLAVTGVLPGATLNCTISVLVTPGATVTPAGSTTFTIRVTPTATGPFSASFAVTNDDANENPYDINISGNGTSGGGLSGGGGGGGGGGGCASSPVKTLPLAALVMVLAGVAAVRRRRA